MKILKAEELYVIRPMKLLRTSENLKATFPLTKRKKQIIAQNYLSSASDITIASLANNEFESIFSNERFALAEDKLPNNIDTFVYTNYKDRLADLLFTERMRAANSFTLNDILNYGFYETWQINLFKIEQEILSKNYSIEELKRIADNIKKQAKDKIISLGLDYSSEPYKIVSSSETKIKTFKKRKQQ